MGTPWKVPTRVFALHFTPLYPQKAISCRSRNRHFLHDLHGQGFRHFHCGSDGTRQDRVQHPHFYYPDGNICLLAEKTVFRCFRSMLSRESERLDELFKSFIEDSNQDIAYEGVPAVRVEGSVSDWEVTLSFLWTTRLEKPTLSEAWAILRVAHTYRFQKARQLALNQVEEYLSETSPAATLDVYRTGRFSALEVIRDARLCQVPEFLPLAFYAVAFFDMTDQTTLQDIEDMGLNITDMARIQIGQRQIRARWWKFVKLGPKFISCDCASNDPETSWTASLTTTRLQEASTSEADPLFYLKPPVVSIWWPMPETPRASCTDCEVRQSQHNRSIYWKSIIDELPTIFSL